MTMLLHAARARLAAPQHERSSALHGEVWRYTPKASELISEGQRPGNAAPDARRALKGQDPRE